MGGGSSPAAPGPAPSPVGPWQVAQNTTPEQMKMFLTRIGIGAKAVVTGDVTQIDLQRGQKSGLIEARQILREVRAAKSPCRDVPDRLATHQPPVGITNCAPARMLVGQRSVTALSRV